MDKSLVLTKAKAAIMSHDFTTAARLYKELLRDDPSNVDYLKQLGSIYVQAQQDEKAIPYYQQIITFYPHYVEAMNSLGAIYRRLKRYQESIEILQKALDEDRQLPTVNYNLGFTYKEMGNYQDAIEAFEMVIEANPDDVLAYNHLGSIYLAQKDYQRSISAYKRGLQIDRNHPILNYNLARAYQASGNESEAIRCYQSTLKTRPGWKDCISDYSGLLLKCQKNKEAQDLVNQAIKLHPTDADLLSILGTIYLNEYDYENAETTFKKANAIKGNDVKILSGLAEALEKGEKVENALDAVLTAMEVDPENKDIKKQYVHTLLSAEDYEKAYDNVKELYEDGGDRDVQVLDLYGQYHITQNEEEEAKKYYSKIERINGKYKDYQVNAAQRFNQIGNYEAAEVYAKEFVRHKPHSAEGYNMLGKISTSKGDLAGAKFYYGKSKEFKKPNALADVKIQSINEQILNNDIVQNDFVPPQDIEPIVETEETPAENIEEETSDETFDYAQMGGNVPLQEGLLEDDENFWGDEEENPEETVEEETPEEEEPEEEEEPQSMFGNLGDLANPDDEPFDFGDDIGKNEEDEMEPEMEPETEGTDPLEEESSEPEPMPEPEYEFPPLPKQSTPEPEPEPMEEEPIPPADPEPAPYKEPEPAPAENPLSNDQENMLNRMMQEQAMRSAQQAMQAALEAQKMAEQLADEQFLLRKETENALQEALDKVKEMGEEQLQKLEIEKAEIEKAVVDEVETPTDEIESEGSVPETEESVPKTQIETEGTDPEVSEVPAEDIIENFVADYLQLSPEYAETIEMDVDFVTLSEIEEAIDYAIANAPANVPFANVEEIAEDIVITETPAEIAAPTIEETPLEDVGFDSVDNIIIGDVTEEAPAEDVAFESVDNIIVGDVSEEVEIEAPAEEAPAEDVAFDSVDNIIVGDVSEEAEIETPAEETPTEDVVFDSVDNIIVGDVTDEAETETPAEEAPTEDVAFDSVDNIVVGDVTSDVENESPLEDVTFDSVDSLVTGDVEIAASSTEAEPTALEDVSFDSVDNIADEVSPSIEEENFEIIENEEPVIEETYVDIPDADDNLAEVKLTLERIQGMLNDSQKALENSEKIEMFKALRVLGSYLPESDKNSFQSCRNRMMIDYIIAKMSGKPGLLQTAQALINTGVLGDEYSDRITGEDSEEISNEMIKNVLIAMKNMASNLTDKELAQSLCSTADNILERLEMVGDDEQLF